MPDPYWENVRKDLEKKRLLGAGSESSRWNDPQNLIMELVCKKCGEKFMAPGNRKICDDCKPEREYKGTRNIQSRLRESQEMDFDVD